MIIGERLNSSNKKVRSWFEERDESRLMDLARLQQAGGAGYLDLNLAMLRESELDTLIWMGELVRGELPVGIAVDSPHAEVLRAGALRFKEACIINSLTSDREELLAMLPVIADTGAGVIVMLKNREGIPETAAGRLRLAREVAETMAGEDIPGEKVFFDPVFTPLATAREGLVVVLETIQGLRDDFGAFQTIGGLSNVSYGLPLRKLLNRTFLAMILARGITALICDPTDKNLMETLRVAEMIEGKDPGCREFLRYFRGRAK